MLPLARIRKLSSVAVLAACTALSSAVHAQQTTPAISRQLPHKDPMTATILGIVFPGGGQIYTERWGKAVGIFTGTAAAVGLAIDAANNGQHDIETVWIVGAVAVWGYGWLTAGSDAERRNTQMLNTTFAPFLDRYNGHWVAGLSLATH